MWLEESILRGLVGSILEGLGKNLCALDRPLFESCPRGLANLRRATAATKAAAAKTVVRVVLVVLDVEVDVAVVAASPVVVAQAVVLAVAAVVTGQQDQEDLGQENGRQSQTRS